MIKVINKTFDILELLAKEPETPFTLSQIADAMDMNHGTCANILKTIMNRGYIEQIGHRKGYRMGAKFYYLTNNLSYKKDLVNAAKDTMIKLTQSVNENTILAVIKGDKRLILYDVPSDQDLQVRTSPEKNLYETATGRLLLAYLGPEDQEAFITQFGLPRASIWKEAATKKGLVATLSKIRQKGIARQVTNKQIVGLAAPICLNNVAVASLGLYIPEIRFNADNKKQIESELKLAAGTISKQLNPDKSI